MKKKLICPKCKSKGIRTRYHKDEYGNWWNVHSCERYGFTQINKEHLHYYCEDCLYDWGEKL